MTRLTILVLLLMAVLGACNTPVTTTETPTLTATERIIPITIVQNTPTLARTRIPLCPQAPPPRLIVYERGQVTDNDRSLNMRDGPGLENDVLIQLRPLSIFRVTAEPVCRDDYLWYPVEYQGILGWIAEGDSEEYYALPFPRG